MLEPVLRKPGGAFENGPGLFVAAIARDGSRAGKTVNGRLRPWRGLCWARGGADGGRQRGRHSHEGRWTPW